MIMIDDDNVEIVNVHVYAKLCQDGQYSLEW